MFAIICVKSINKGNEHNTKASKRANGGWGNTMQKPPRQNRFGQSVRLQGSSAWPVPMSLSTDQRSPLRTTRTCKSGLRKQVHRTCECVIYGCHIPTPKCSLSRCQREPRIIYVSFTSMFKDKRPPTFICVTCSLFTCASSFY